MSPQIEVFEGFWTNWSYGQISGATLTLSSQGGPFLLAFLALYVSVTGSQFWRIVAFTYHQAIVCQAPRDGLHRQHRLITRSSSAPSSVLEILQLIYAWRSRAHRPILRSIPFLLLAISNIAVFSVASIFSSRVTIATGDHVLIRGPHCGQWGLDNSGTIQEKIAYLRHLNDGTTQAFNYARFCYKDARTMDANCEGVGHHVQQIAWTTYYTSCPFEPGVCFNNTNAYGLDTESIDSHYTLGINARPMDRVTLRKVLSCAVIPGERFMKHEKVKVTTALQSDQIYQRFYMGPKGDQPYTFQYGQFVVGGSEDHGYSLR